MLSVLCNFLADIIDIQQSIFSFNKIYSAISIANKCVINNYMSGSQGSSWALTVGRSDFSLQEN